MKNYLKTFLAMGCIGLLMLSACKKSGALVTSNGGTPGALTATATTLVLDKTKVNDVSTVAIGFNYTQANYGFSAAITNTLQIDVPSDNFAKPVSATLGSNVLSQTYDTPDFNSLLLKLGIPGGTTATVNVRIASTISSSITPVYSNVVALTVTPFNLKSYLYAVGAFEGWNLSNVDSLCSATGNGIYAGIINFTAGNNQWLLLPQKTNYNNKYATNDNGPNNTTVTVNAGGNLYAPSAAGQYLVTFNSNSSTISYAASDYYSIIGDGAQGWSTDVPMKYVNDGNGNWVVTLPLVSTGSFKVRQDDAWSASWGTLPTPDGLHLTDSNGGNIPVPVSGNYTMTFGAPATIFGSPALTTTTYSLVKH